MLESNQLVSACKTDAFPFGESPNFLDPHRGIKPLVVGFVDLVRLSGWGINWSGARESNPFHTAWKAADGPSTIKIAPHVFGIRGWTRTNTTQGLNLLTLPIGLHGHYFGETDRTLTCIKRSCNPLPKHSSHSLIELVRVRGLEPPVSGAQDQRFTD